MQAGNYKQLKDGRKIPQIIVKTDGAWSRRSYRGGRQDSMSGYVVIIGAATNKVLFMGYRNKFCSLCDLAERQKRPIRRHRCFKNWDYEQSSLSMETDMILEGFMQSFEVHGLIYKTIISDRDSSTFHCLTQSKPYRRFAVEVNKINCVNHVWRSFGGKYKELAEAPITVPKVIPHGTVGKYRDMLRNKGKPIRNTVKELIANVQILNVNFDEKVKILRNQILNITDHAFGDHTKYKDAGIVQGNDV